LPTVTHAVHETFFRTCRRRLAVRAEIFSMVTLDVEQASGQPRRDKKLAESAVWVCGAVGQVPIVVTARLNSWQPTGRLTAGRPRRSIGTA
jgi:hypothetical protein